MARMIAKKMQRLLKQHLFWLIPVSLGLALIGLRTQLGHFDQQVKIQLAQCVAPLLRWQHQLVTKFQQVTDLPAEPVHLQQELTALKQQVDQLTAENISLKATQKYFNDIQELLEFRQRYNLTHAIPAQIIMKHLADTEHYFYLDRGTVHGVQVNTVAVDHNRLVGRVTAVYPTYSKLALVTDRACKIAAYCVATQVAGLSQGLNRLDYLALKHIDHLQELVNGDAVLSSGEGLIFPQGFAICTVKEFSRQGVDYEVLVEPAVDLQNLQYCLLLV